MKQLIIRKSFLNSSLVRTSFTTGVLLWALCQVPLLLVFFGIYGSNEKKAKDERTSAVENVLVETFLTASRFGDIVNARGQILRLGKPFGLNDVELCRGSEDILQRFGESRCEVEDQILRQHLATLSDGPISIRFKWDDVDENNYGLIIAAILTSASVSLLLIVLTTGSTYLALSKKIRELCLGISSLAPNTDSLDTPKNAPEFQVVTSTVLKLKSDLQKYHDENVVLATRAALIDLARQVAHDIRSPLSALKIVASSDLPEEKTTLIQTATERIATIADTMLSRTRQQNLSNDLTDAANTQPTTTGLPNTLLNPLVESIVSEKRMEFKSRPELEICLSMDPNAIALCDPLDIGRVLSNLINNSAEAFDESPGRIDVSVKSYRKTVTITVADNGRGIPADILPTLAQEGATFGKVNGNGLGLFHAKKTVEKWGGRIQIQSKEGIGTIICITLSTSSDAQAHPTRN